MATDECFFKWKYMCDCKEEKLIESGRSRIESIIKCSKIYHDEVHQQLENSLEVSTDFTLKCHKSCVSTYTSTTQIQRHIKRKQKAEGPSVITPKRTILSCASTFSFQDHCLFCGANCYLEKNAKNPARWNPAYLFREVEPKGGNKSLKQSILDVCDLRGDEWASAVKTRIHGVISDLHAADARYHVSCRCKFMGKRAVTTSARSSTSTSEEDDALLRLIETVKQDFTRTWNSVELFKAYTEYEGNKLSRMRLVKGVSEYFGEDLLVLSYTGIASILIFRSKASTVVRLVDEEEDDLDTATAKISKKIKSEIKAIPTDKLHYETEINRDIATESVSETLLKLLKELSPKLDKTLSAILVGSMITSAMRNHPTTLQIDLGVLMRDSKKLVNHMHAFGVTCSYDEVLRFKKSAALAATTDMDLSGISRAEGGLVQVVVDNFDADIFSQNGKRSTHSLAVLLTQKEQGGTSSDNDKQVIKRIKKSELSEPIQYDLKIQRFSGVKHPELPERASRKSVQPLRVLAHKVLSRQRADDTDTAFLKDGLFKQKCPEFNGYNTANSRPTSQLLMDQRYSG